MTESVERPERIKSDERPEWEKPSVKRLRAGAAEEGGSGQVDGPNLS